MPNSLEKRVEALERAVERLRLANGGTDNVRTEVPWWDRIRGTFADDSVFEEAMRLGRQYRKKSRPRQKKRR